MAKFCSKCGKELADDEFFCTQCGTKQKIDKEPIRTNNPVVSDKPIMTNSNNELSGTDALENCKKVTYVAGALTAISVFCNFMELNMPGLINLSFSIMDISSLLGIYIMLLGIAAVFGTFKNEYGASFAVNLGIFLGFAIGFCDASSSLGANLSKVMGMGAYLLIVAPLVGAVANIMCRLVKYEKKFDAEKFFSEVKTVIKQETEINGIKLPNYVIAILVIVFLEIISSQVNFAKMGW